MKLETQMRIAANLKRLRNSRGLSQTDIAAKLQMDRSIFSLYESGRRSPDTEALYHISRYLGVPMELLLETDPDRVVSEAACLEVCDDGERKLMSVFRTLSPFSKGRLLEKAESLAEGDAFQKAQRKALQEKSNR
ncbi:MAG: helix-turn-helix transcriptional regulator [Firmicutes bacterium]|jgi:transcriptional regulator with XRE-family HTH domain|nr:helix-turn-helix transcriptional regulator [Bacillota bacterium]